MELLPSGSHALCGATAHAPAGVTSVQVQHLMINAPETRPQVDASFQHCASHGLRPPRSAHPNPRASILAPPVHAHGAGLGGSKAGFSRQFGAVPLRSPFRTGYPAVERRFPRSLLAMSAHCDGHGRYLIK